MTKYNVNHRRVLKLIFNNVTISRAQISRELNLERSTVSYIIKDLEEQNIVCFGEKLVTGGRTSLNLEINHEFCENLIINMKKNTIIFDITSFAGEKINVITIKTNDFNTMTAEILKTISVLMQVYKKISNIIIAYHGMINIDYSESFSPFYEIDTYNLFKKIKLKFGITAQIKNESNLIALGYQDIYSSNNLLVISIDQGVGCGIIVDSKLMTGNDGYAGEFGHQIVNLKGPLCPCGNRGCLELLCSEKVLSNATESEITSAIDYLSVGINNYVLAFNPKMVIIRSKIFHENDKFVEQLQKNLNSKNLNTPEIISVYRKNSDILRGATKSIFTDFINR